MRLGLHHSRSISLLSLRNFFRSCFLVSTGTHLMYISLALRYRENAAINKEQTQTKYSDVINFHSIIAGLYCCSLDPPLHCPGFSFHLWMTRSKWSTSPGTFVFYLLFHIGVFTGKITEATKNNKFALF